MKSHRTFLILLSVFLVLAILGDATTTSILAGRGVGIEGNPVMRWLIEYLGIETAMIIKIIATVIIAFIAIQRYKTGYAPGTIRGLVYLIVLYSWAVIGNIFVSIDKEYLIVPLMLTVIILLFGVIFQDKLKKIRF